MRITEQIIGGGPPRVPSLHLDASHTSGCPIHTQHFADRWAEGAKDKALLEGVFSFWSYIKAIATFDAISLFYILIKDV